MSKRSHFSGRLGLAEARALPEPQGLLLRGALAAVTLAVLAGAGTYLWARGQPPEFRAEAVVLLAGGTEVMVPAAAEVRAPPIDAGAFRAAAASEAVLEEALRAMGHGEPDANAVRDLRSAVLLETEVGRRDSSLLRIAAHGTTPGEATLRADAVSSALVEWDRQHAGARLAHQRAALERRIRDLDQEIRVLQAIGQVGDGFWPHDDGQLAGLARLHGEQVQRLAFVSALADSAHGMASVIQPADTTVVQVAPRPVVSAALGAALALAVASGLLLLHGSIETPLRGAADIAAVAGRPVLAEFPRSGGPGDRHLREVASYLRTNLHLGVRDADQRVIAVTSPGAGEGKTFVATALAESFARYGHRTLLVDADLRSPSVVRRFDVVGGLTDTATTERWLAHPEAEHRLLRVSVGRDSELDVLPQPRPVDDASELLGRRLRLALTSVSVYDIIVIDTPPALEVSDALVVAPHCTGVLVVVDRRITTRRRLAASIASLQQIGIVEVAVVANRVGVSAGGTSSYGSTRLILAGQRVPWQPSRSAR
jgi:capsular exopolysaccharide synthesis family protein